ncbi:antitoxin family protein [Aphanothece sacrum]|uniref:DUF104 domain-containing protein n=1 Tax=Aphanothece sacrum FPU1 TaxID=1920663 RepID=A0A401IKL4_APHSA|nr:antitoxin family protein [Aphanothece sacrum]GBF81774.1 hypothetical protein AsFPU1_3194 [Aphanothece sacrum FPU1]GBF84306.1 hypothetical protein AsFPU3_1354 [Aphanothece sacrum FPU3]
MLQTILATVRQGKIEPLEPIELPEGTKVIVTLLPESEREFWTEISQMSLNTVIVS